jgi:uncharacterized protein (DUF983 family)
VVDEPTEPGHDPGVSPLPLTVPRLLARGLAGRCPLCGASGLFQRWFTLRERCPRCNFALEERVEGHWLGSLGMNTIVSFGALFVTLVVGVAIAYPDGALGTLLAVAVTVAVVVPLVFFPFSKTLWSAIDLAMRPLEPDDDVDPRWIPPPAHPRH